MELKMFEDFMSRFDIAEIVFVSRLLLITAGVGILALMYVVFKRFKS